MAAKREMKPKQIVRPSRAEMADLFDKIVQSPTGDALKDLSANIESALALAVKIEEVGEMLKSMQADLNHKLTKFIPDSMRACHMTEFTHASGMKVVMHDFLSGSLPKDPDKRRVALRWIHDNGGKDLIRNKFNIELERGDEKTRKGMIAALHKVHVDFQETVDVNHMSMQAFVRERMANGLAVPLDTLGLYAGVTAKIVPPKVKKVKAPAPAVVAPAASPKKGKPVAKPSLKSPPKRPVSAPAAKVKVPSRRRETPTNIGL